MVAARVWIKEAAEVFVEEIGKQKALSVVKRLQRISGANKSVESTLIKLRNEIASDRHA